MGNASPVATTQTEQRSVNNKQANHAGDKQATHADDKQAIHAEHSVVVRQFSLHRDNSVEFDPSDGSEPVLTADEFRPLELESTRDVNYNTKVFRFKFPHDSQQLEQKIAVFYFVRATINGEVIQRPYTPVSPIDARGYLDLLVKVYAPPYGKMGNHLSQLKPGDTVEFKGPIAKLPYTPNQYKHILMLAGGSGITPMYQMLQAIWGSTEDFARVTLLFSNHSPRDVMLRDELSALKALRPAALSIHYIVSQAEDSWDGEVGHIDEQLLERLGGIENVEDTLALVCGPPSFTKAMAGPKLIIPGQRPQQGPLLGLLKQSGFGVQQVFKF